MLDLKESGDIEAHASHILLLYTPIENSAPTGSDEIIVGKNRTGPLGSIDAVFDRSSLTFAPRETSYAHE
jgi:replicative DNA helicase